MLDLSLKLTDCLFRPCRLSLQAFLNPNNTLFERCHSRFKAANLARDRTRH